MSLDNHNNLVLLLIRSDSSDLQEAVEHWYEDKDGDGDARTTTTATTGAPRKEPASSSHLAPI